jgi:VWFA-related protein
VTRLLLAVVIGCLTAARWQAPTIVVDVGVEDAKGNPITDVRPEEFEILADSRPRELASFSNRSRPLSTVMLVDVTASMSRLALKDDDGFRRTLEGFVADLHAGDRASLGRVSAESPTSGPVSGDRATLLRDMSDLLNVRDADRLGPSPLWDALAAAIEKLSHEAGSRAVLLWTDGHSTGNHLGLTDVINRATAAGVSVHLIVQRSAMRRSRGSRGWKNEDFCAPVSSVTDATGGLCLVNRFQGSTLEMNEAPAREIRRVLNSLRHRYQLGLSANSDGGQLHVLEVRVKRPGLRVRAPTRFRAKWVALTQSEGGCERGESNPQGLSATGS